MKTRNKDTTVTRTFEQQQSDFKDVGIPIRTERSFEGVERKLSSTYKEKSMTNHKCSDGDVEIPVKITDTELTDAELKLLEDRYFIPIQRPGSPIEVCQIN